MNRATEKVAQVPNPIGDKCKNFLLREHVLRERGFVERLNESHDSHMRRLSEGGLVGQSVPAAEAAVGEGEGDGGVPVAQESPACQEAVEGHVLCAVALNDSPL